MLALSRSRRRESSSVSAVAEALEPRRLRSAVAPTADEQYMVELLNRARANPAAEAKRFGIDLNEGLKAGTISTAAKQPLAINPFLTDAGRKHSAWMNAHNTFAHNETNGGVTTDPGQRMKNAGYSFTGSYGWGENIAFRGSNPTPPPLTATVAAEHQDLFVDAGIAGRGHRTNLEAPKFKEVGVGLAAGVFQGYKSIMATQDFAYSGASSFLTGVAYKDSVKADAFYTVGEGLAGVRVTATRTSDKKVFSATTWSSGGYSLALPAGAYTVVASGKPLVSAITFSKVTIGALNVKVDFVPKAAAVTAAPAAAGTWNASIAPVGGAAAFRATARDDIFGGAGDVL